MDIESPERAILTIRTCPTLAALEKEGTGREKLICQDLTTSLFTRIAHHFNPKMIVTALKVPPRKSYSNCSSQWEFRLDR